MKYRVALLIYNLRLTEHLAASCPLTRSPAEYRSAMITYRLLPARLIAWAENL